ncbi:MAG: HU family DNA-binding protein [Acidimicrobiales bacterium]
MNKAEMVENISRETGVMKRHVEQVVNSLFSTVASELRAGRRLSVIGFGSFNPTRRSARTGRNPRTGEPIKIPASKSVRFSAGSALKDVLNGKALAKKAPAKKAAVKAVAKKAPVKKAPAKAPAKAVAKKAPAKKAAVKAVAKKAPVKKAPAKKAAVRR